jgi:hypothetical protein
MKVEYMHACFNEQQQKVYEETLKSVKVKTTSCFIYQDLIIKGTSWAASVVFAYTAPDGSDFYQWLKDNCTILGKTI